MSRTPATTKAFTVWSAAMLGIGAMVGAGIFIVIGQTAAIAGNLAWVSFLIGGLVSLAAGYSLAKLALAFPSRGGIVEYLVQLYGEGPFAGAGGILFYLAQVIGIAAVAKAFGVYGGELFAGMDVPWMQNLLALGVIALFALVNSLGASWVSRSESLIVAVKLGILSIFTLVALWNIDPHRLTPPESISLTPLFFAAGLAFFAYQGFSLICNTVEDMQRPQRDMPRAIALAILLVSGLYVAISLAVTGTLSLPQIQRTQEYALAEAARPLMGETGFRLMALAALISTASAINATLYATAEITYTLIRRGALPALYRFHRFENMEGLWMTALLAGIPILSLDLSQIALLATFAVLLIQTLVHFGHAFQIRQTQARALPVWLAALGTLGVTGLILQQAQKAHPHLGLMLFALLMSAFISEMWLYHRRGRQVKKQTPKAAPSRDCASR